MIKLPDSEQLRRLSAFSGDSTAAWHLQNALLAELYGEVASALVLRPVVGAPRLVALTDADLAANLDSKRSTSQYYLQQMLQIEWRTWLTERFLADWLDGRAYYQLQLLDSGTDNPDQLAGVALRRSGVCGVSCPTRIRT